MASTAGINARQRKAIEQLVLHGDASLAAKEAGIARSTLYEWLARDDFRAALRTAERGALDELGRILLRLTKTAALTIGSTMTDRTAKPETRLRAADVAIQRLLQLRQVVDIEERLAEIEATLKALGERGDLT